MKIKTLLLILLLQTFQLFSQQIPTNALSSRNANYNIQVLLDPILKTIDGKEKLIWKNITNSPVNELQFHLYLNAFKNTSSTFMLESGTDPRGFSLDKDDSVTWGWIEVTSLKIKDEGDLTDSIQYYQPDDQNANDQTVIRIPLNNSVAPGQTIEVDINFTAKLPRIIARTGYSDDYFLVGQWFPKIGVFEAIGQRGRLTAGWNCHQLHANSEFYADFGNYNVEITLPRQFIVGATGILQKENSNKNGTKTLTYKADDVIDFAWTASPIFEVVTDKWNDVQITLLLQPQHLSQADRHILSAKKAFEYFDKYLGKFPYPSITIVDPPFRGLASAGMEYPMFITAGCLWGIPDEFRFTESVTIHELGHNYFMGILASNEFEEAWLDEGFNTYFENRIMDHFFGDKYSMIDLFGFHFGDAESSRLSYTNMKYPYRAIINELSWNYPNGGYSVSSYSKSGVVLATLENLIGSERMNKVLKEYYTNWKFKHPSTQDFIDEVNRVLSENPDPRLGNDLNWFFNQALNSGDICDYEVSKISNEKKRNDWGIFDSDSKKIFLSDVDNKTYKYRTKTLITRIGEFKVPQEILFHFEDGEEILEYWDGQERSKTFIFDRDDALKWVQIDPTNKILLDVKLSNNSLNTENETSVIWKYTAKILFWAQNAMITMFF